MAIAKELEDYLIKEEGYLILREVPGRGICGIYPFIFTFGLVYGIDSEGYKGRWCYKNAVEAAIALASWDGEGDPSFNWIKYKGIGGERSNPNLHDEFKTS